MNRYQFFLLIEFKPKCKKKLSVKLLKKLNEEYLG